MILIFFFKSCFNIAQIDDDDELNEFPNYGKNNNTCGGEIIDCNECLIDETGIIEEYEDINSIENESEPFVGQCFLSEEEAFIFYKNYANQNGFTIQKGHLEKKKLRNRKA